MRYGTFLVVVLLVLTACIESSDIDNTDTLAVTHARTPKTTTHPAISTESPSIDSTDTLALTHARTPKTTTHPAASVSGPECGILVFDTGSTRLRMSEEPVGIKWSRDWTRSCGWVYYDSLRYNTDTSADVGPHVWLGVEDNTAWVRSQIASWDWSPDGRWIAYLEEGRFGDLLVWTSQYAKRTKLASDVVAFSWSQKGEWLAYLAVPGDVYDGNLRLWVWSSKTERSQTLSDTVPWDGLDWSPATSLIAYSSLGKLFAHPIDIEPTEPIAITVGKWDWSPDGKHIAYSNGADTYYGSGNLWLYSLQSRRTERIATNIGKWDWSPTGERVGYTNRDASRDLIVWSIDGNRYQTLASNIGTDGNDWDWSYDGTLIAYTDGDNHDGDLWVVSVDGKDISRAATITRSYMGFEAWRWAQQRNAIAYRSNLDLYVWSADHRETVSVAEDTYYFDLSPDGSLLAFAGRYGTFIVDIARLFEQ